MGTKMTFASDKHRESEADFLNAALERGECVVICRFASEGRKIVPPNYRIESIGPVNVTLRTPEGMLVTYKPKRIT